MKSSNITFDKVDGYIGKYACAKYLALFHSNKTMREFFLELGILLF